ncbi:hypothetical protein HS125_09445 [bacterium]|nr:hypothetical protein [bacterium]
MEKNENIPRLVKGWTISEDGLDYTFPLRTDVRWHDGERFDADDVLYSFATCMNPEVPAGHARSDYMEFALTESLPADDGDGKLEAHEYLRLELSGLPSLSSAPVLDGAPEPEAAVLLSGTQTALGAAVWGDFLYLWGLQSARHDLAVFVARQPGDSVAYGP